MWSRKIKKVIYTLAIDGYDEDVTSITFPLLKRYADKLRAEFVVINTRKFLEWPITYEKLQIYELAQQNEAEWHIYIDADALIHPDTFDITTIVPKDTVLHFGSDYASTRWRFDQYFLRDGRQIGSGNWLTMASDWCLDLWHPLEDMTAEEAIANIFPIIDETRSEVFKPSHFIDDYILGRNIARYGLKFYSLKEHMDKIKRSMQMWHQFLLPKEAKVIEMRKIIKSWGVMP
jgi:hypothetical protein